MSVIRVYYRGSRWCVGIGDRRLGVFTDPIAAINYALNEVAEVLDLPVQWPESVVLA